MARQYCHLTLFQVHEITSSKKKVFYKTRKDQRCKSEEFFLRLSKHFLMHMISFVFDIYKKNYFTLGLSRECSPITLNALYIEFHHC